MKWFFSSIVAGWVVILSPLAAADGGRLVVVELFTSQGCSSCPPADEFLGELADRGDVLALSQHVDYWDYLGWKDPFASKTASQRQRAYAERMGLRYVYTPQMVVQGETQATGTDRALVLAAIDRQKGAGAIAVSVSDQADRRLSVEIGSAAQPVAADVWLVIFDRRHRTDVKKGENHGRNLQYRNVVRRMEHLGVWTGVPLTLTAGLPLATPEQDSAVVLQETGTGAILGAAQVARSR